jgi:membrane dipeptidase
MKWNKLTRREAAMAFAGALAGCGRVEAPAPEAVHDDAALLARTVVFDAHCDTPGPLLREGLDLSERKPYHQVDIPRMREGGISASFFAVFTSPKGKTEPEATKLGFELRDKIVAEVAKYPQDLVLALSTAEIEQAKRDGKIAILLSLEGGHMIDNSLENLRKYRELGIRSMGLTHGLSTAWAQSAESAEGPGGLTDFGREVVAECNRLGVVVDLAHAADETLFQTIEASKAPVIHSHSACRALCNNPRNLSDEMLKALADNGGVLAIGYYNGMIVESYGQPRPDMSDLDAKRVAIEKEFAGDRDRRLTELWKVDEEEVERLGRVPFEKLLDHFEHAAKVAGPEHVGFGSDLDAANHMYPVDASDIADTPKLIPGLRGRGFSDEEIAGILGGNMMRVLRQAEKAAAV